MEIDFINQALKEFYQENRNQLLSKEEIIELSKKKISLSNFSGYNSSNTQRVCNDETIIFGFKEGLLFTTSQFYVFDNLMSNRVQSFSFYDFFSIEAFHKTFIKSGTMKINGVVVKKESADKFNLDFYEKLKIKLEEAKHKYIQSVNDAKNLEIQNQKVFEKSQSNILNDFDKDGDGAIDLLENDFNRLLSKNQKKVIETDKEYVHKFVKVSSFIKTKKDNTQKIFESIRDTSSQEELEERVALLKNQIYSYELLVFHSINMIGALVSEDLITFYEIYESFDKLGMFNSNWENEISEKLTNIGDKLDDLMYSIYNMEQNIVNELSHLSYVTQESFEDLNRSVTSQLREVESSINTNNLLTGIQAYQLYKINKNTKGLR